MPIVTANGFQKFNCLARYAPTPLSGGTVPELPRGRFLRSSELWRPPCSLMSMGLERLVACESAMSDGA